MTDELIIKGLCNFDEKITKNYFYDYCRKAYNIFDFKYNLSHKTGIDFYSLAHDYYIFLLTHEFKPLLDRPQNVKLSTWMANGFHFTVLDALKDYNKEFSQLPDTASDDILEYIRSTDNDEHIMELVADEISSHYANDRVMQEIGYMMFYAGFHQKDVAAQLKMTPSAVNQRYKKIMDEVVTPFIIENYSQGTYQGAVYESPETSDSLSYCENISDHDIMPRFSFINRIGAFSNSNLFSKKRANDNRITSDNITVLASNEIFVFGSNLLGMHAGGAARTAYKCFGAEMGNGDGLQGQSYAIPTMQGGVETIKPYVDKFIEFAKQHHEMRFLVTPIGCGIAGFEPEDIAPLFKEAVDIENVALPKSFWEVLD